MMSILDSCRCGCWRHFHRQNGGCNCCGCGRFHLFQTEAEYAELNPKHYAEVMLPLKPKWEKIAA
jgi:hypothetical protein